MCVYTYINYTHTTQNYTYYKLYTPHINYIQYKLYKNHIHKPYNLHSIQTTHYTTIYYLYKLYTHIYYTQLILNTNHKYTHITCNPLAINYTQTTIHAESIHKTNYIRTTIHMHSWASALDHLYSMHTVETYTQTTHVPTQTMQMRHTQPSA